jgi:hypothetical protein
MKLKQANVGYERINYDILEGALHRRDGTYRVAVPVSGYWVQQLINRVRRAEGLIGVLALELETAYEELDTDEEERELLEDAREFLGR